MGEAPMAAAHTRSVALLADQLTEGFVALSGEYRLLLDKYKKLEDQLEWAKQQHLISLKRLTSDDSEKDEQDYLTELEEAGNGAPNGASDWLEQLSRHQTPQRRSHAYLIMQADLACGKLNRYAAVKEVDGVKIWNGASADNDMKEEVDQEIPKGCPRHQTSHPLETDFTVRGTPSKLMCPLARVRRPSNLRHSMNSSQSSVSKMNSSAHTRRSKLSSMDPIKAEKDSAQSPEVNVEEVPTTICPIRFLDQHKPEEVAAYFEKHKHEIPRSHEVCIKRFQSNSAQIRQLDDKYGNLVSMIEGLGHKHQPMLPEKLEEDDEDAQAGDDGDGGDTANIEKWANTVSTSMENGKTDATNGVVDVEPELSEPEPDPNDERQSHFDRTLTEVRVGESPSRPWGIRVPVKYSNAGSAVSHDSPATASPQLDQPSVHLPSVPQPRGCPFDHTKLQLENPREAIHEDLVAGGNPHAHDLEAMLADQGKATDPFEDAPRTPSSMPLPKEPVAQIIQPTAAPAQMIFHGPVFFGYSPEQVKELLSGGLFNKS